MDTLRGPLMTKLRTLLDKPALHLLLGAAFMVVFTWPFLAIEKPVDTWTFLYGAWGLAIVAIFVVSLGEPQVDDFGTFAEGVVRIPAGRWRITTLSDDGVRIVARRLEVGKTEPETWIENWTHHGPTVDEHMMFLQDETAFALVVEHFELDGHAWLELDFEWLGAE